jgi:hypothetical protein
MPKNGFEDLDMLQELFATGREERTDLAGLRGQREPASVWTPRLTPILMLLQEVLTDLFEVRDRVRQAQSRGGKPARAVLRQYERDLQWLRAQEERVSFSFGWVCQALGLDASAVRRRYLSGQPVARTRRHTGTVVLRAWAPPEGRIGQRSKKESMTLLKIEKERAKQRQAEQARANQPQARKSLKVELISPAEKNKARDAVGKKVGVSGLTAERAVLAVKGRAVVVQEVGKAKGVPHD